MDEKIVFETGCPVKDHKQYLNYCIENELLVIESSSFTHLVMDFDAYRFVLNGDGIEILIHDIQNVKPQVYLLLSENMRMVLKNHPELVAEYIDQNSSLYNCKNAVDYRNACYTYNKV